MFFVASKILGWLVFPLSLALLTLLSFWWKNRRREKVRWRGFWVAMAILWFCASPWGADMLLLPLERPYPTPATPPPADVIVVLGGALDLAASAPGRLQFHQASDRFVYALELARSQPQAKLVFTGGTADLFDQTKTEASLLKAEAITLGVAPERILVDNRSRNTHENALETQRILQQVGGRNVLLVTSAFHMRRSLACFRKVGLEAIPYAVDLRGHGGHNGPFGWVPQADVLSDATAAVREYVGWVVYRLKGYV